MLFNSLAFLFIFYPAVLLATYLVPRKQRNLILLIASIFFMLFACGTNFRSLKGLYQGFLSVDFWMLVGYIFFNYALGLGLRFQKDPGTRKGLLVTGLVMDALPLFVYKIFSVVPLGLSFYTFQSVSYLVDVYRGKARAEKSFTKFTVYMAMFPRILQGPMIRYDDIAKSLYQRKLTDRNFLLGLEDLILGLGLKVIMAGQIGRLWSNILTIGAESISVPLAWMGAVAYSLQLYFDFAGYSRMAIGMGRMLGLDIPENFNYPYISRTMGEFWRRWHMTLGSWFRDYIYIPLGGNRKGAGRTVLNMLVVWLLTGFWHGFGWNFILWGLATFGLIVLERFVIGKWMDKIPVIGHLYMALVIPLMWMIFANTDIRILFQYFARLFGSSGEFAMAGDYLKYGSTYGLWLVLGIILSTPGPRKLYEFLRKRSPFFIVPILLGIFWVSVYWMYKGQSDPFMYFHF